MTQEALVETMPIREVFGAATVERDSSSTLPLLGKSAIVTGAGSGIGLAVAESFSKAGARVVFACHDGARATEVASGMCAQGGDAIGVALELTQVETIDRCLEVTAQRFGSVDILFNAAGVFAHRSLLTVKPNTFEQLWNVNVLGSFLMLQACAQLMIAQGQGGKIINVASIAARQGRAGTLEYNATKAALVSITQTAAAELIGYGINVNAIAPGPIATGMWCSMQREVGEKLLKLDASAYQRAVEAQIPARRIGRPTDLTNAALFLASPASDYIVGQTINIDGGIVMS